VAQLDHPSIVRLYEVTVAEVNGEKSPVVVLEYVAGETPGSGHQRHSPTTAGCRPSACCRWPTAVAHAHSPRHPATAI